VKALLNPTPVRQGNQKQETAVGCWRSHLCWTTGNLFYSI